MADEDEEVKVSYEYLDGEQETVEWLSRAGRVRATYPNGDSYVGEVNDLKQRHGQGVYTIAPQKGEEEEEAEEDANAIAHTYSGSWVNGKKEGLGRMSYPDGSSYYGHWADNQPNGEGSYTYPNGDIYSGAWLNGARQGNGTYLFAANDSQLVGVWENGQVTNGRWVHKNGTSWHGKFKAGNPIGKGSFYTHGGNQINGEYVEILLEDGEEEDSTELVWKTEANCKASVNPADLVRAEAAKEQKS